MRRLATSYPLVTAPLCCVPRTEVVVSFHRRAQRFVDSLVRAICGSLHSQATARLLCMLYLVQIAAQCHAAWTLVHLSCQGEFRLNTNWPRTCLHAPTSREEKWKPATPIPSASHFNPPSSSSMFWRSRRNSLGNADLWGILASNRAEGILVRPPVYGRYLHCQSAPPPP